MPWQPSDATRHTKKATSPKLKRQWADVANSVLERSGSDALAVREANGAIRDTVANAKHNGRKATRK